MPAAPATCATSVKTYLKPIDRDGLMGFAEKGRNNPASRGTNKVHTVMQGIVRQANFYSPVANSMRNPIPFSIGLVD